MSLLPFVCARSPNCSKTPFALSVYVDLDSDERFTTAAARLDNDAALADVLSGVFASRSNRQWEAELTPPMWAVSASPKSHRNERSLFPVVNQGRRRMHDGPAHRGGAGRAREQ
jgi:hypothetical protein